VVQLRQVPQESGQESDRGAVAVEFALLFPLLIVMLFGTLIVGWRVWEHQAGQSTARQAARDAAVGIDDAGVFARNVVCFGERNGLRTGGLTQIEIDYYSPSMAPSPSAVLGGYVQVSVTSKSRLGAFPMISDSDGTFTSTGLNRVEQLGNVRAPATTTTTGVTCS
jgi:hypothetical protein